MVSAIRTELDCADSDRAAAFLLDILREAGAMIRDRHGRRQKRWFPGTHSPTSLSRSSRLDEPDEPRIGRSDTASFCGDETAR